MYAIVKDRGHQYKVAAGDVISIDRQKTAKEGDTIEMPAMLVGGEDGSVEVGTPLTDKKVTFKVLGNSRGKKGIAGFYRRRKDSRRRVGFRHDFTDVEVVSIG